MHERGPLLVRARARSGIECRFFERQGFTRVEGTNDYRFDFRPADCSKSEIVEVESKVS